MLRRGKTIPLLLLFLFMLPVCLSAAQSPFEKMREEALSYFNPIDGKVSEVAGGKVRIDLGSAAGVRKGMQLQVLKAMAPFKHPVTKEPLGMMESITGVLVIKETTDNASFGEIVHGEAKQGNLVRISGIKVNLLFCQSKGTDWRMADSYHRILKETGRFNLIDTSLETEDPLRVVEEAQRLQADVALLLSAEKKGATVALTQRLLRIRDGSIFSDLTVPVDEAFRKEFSAGADLFNLYGNDPQLLLELPFHARLMTIGDIDGDAIPEIVLAGPREIRVYTAGGELKTALAGARIEEKKADTCIWLDAVDINGNGKDEIIATFMRGEEIFSSIHEFRDGEFILLHRDNLFMRKFGKGIVAQAYGKSEGYSEDVFLVTLDEKFGKGASVGLPAGVNIYDFALIEDHSSGKMVVAYDERTHLNMYDAKGTRIWRSRSGNGGFLQSFAKKSPLPFVDKGEWSVKDRLTVKGNEAFWIKRIPLVEMAAGLGYREAQIAGLRWNGLSMEEFTIIPDVSGTLYDYAFVEDKILVLASPVLGVKTGNILKAENPLKTELRIYKLQ